MLHEEFRLKTSNSTFVLGNGSFESLCTMEFRLPILDCSYLPLHIDVVKADIPLLLCLDVMDRELLVADNVANFLGSRRDNWTILIVQKHGHTFIN